MTRNWRTQLEDPLRKHLELQIREVYKHRKAYELSNDPSKAQLWISLANLSKQLLETNLRINLLERNIKEKQIKKKIIKKKR